MWAPYQTGLSGFLHWLHSALCLLAFGLFTVAAVMPVLTRWSRKSVSYSRTLLTSKGISKDKGTMCLGDNRVSGD